jgi:hypothetical protein
MQSNFSVIVLTVLTLCASSYRNAMADEHHHPEHTAHDSAELNSGANESEEEIAIRESLAKLVEKDRQLAVAQGFCPVMVDNRLGTMGSPVKVMVKNQPVFLCCAGCRRRALANPDQTLAIVETLKAKVESAKIEANMAALAADDRELAEAQGFCPIMVKSRLGAMGTPIKVMVNDQPIFVCCAGCSKKAVANPEKTLVVVAELKAKVAEAAARATKEKASVTTQ